MPLNNDQALYHYAGAHDYPSDDDDGSEDGAAPPVNDAPSGRDICPDDGRIHFDHNCAAVALNDALAANLALNDELDRCRRLLCDLRDAAADVNRARDEFLYARGGPEGGDAIREFFRSLDRLELARNGI